MVQHSDVLLGQELTDALGTMSCGVLLWKTAMRPAHTLKEVSAAGSLCGHVDWACGKNLVWRILLVWKNAICRSLIRVFDGLGFSGLRDLGLFH